MITLTKATTAQAPKLWQIRTQAIEQTCSSHYTASETSTWANSPMPEGFANVLIELGAIVASQNEHILGYGFVDIKTKVLESIMVSPNHGGRGIGKKILAALELEALETGTTSLTLSASLNAVNFYLSCGYLAAETSTFSHPSGLELACVPMSKNLIEP